MYDKLRQHIIRIGRKLWEYGELPAMEYKSCKLLSDWLRKEGFQVQENYCDVPTAFKAVYGTGKPVIGILAEYDALAGLSNAAEVLRRPGGSLGGHACLHNHIGAVNTGAAVAVKEYLHRHPAEGTIILYGCPAEEVLWGKVAMYGRGGFEEADILLTSHVDYQNAAISRPTMAACHGEFIFRGVSVHGGMAPKSNALSGLEQLIRSAEAMQASLYPDASLLHVIRQGGVMPNIVPDSACAWFMVRDREYDRALKLYGFIKEEAFLYGKQLGLEVEERFISAAHGYLPNDTLGALLYECMPDTKKLYSDSEADQLKQLAEAATGQACGDFHQEKQFLQDGYDYYSQDDGEVSRHIPLGRVNWAIPEGMPLHNRCTTVFAGMDLSYRGSLMAGGTLYKAAVRILQCPDIAVKAKQELEYRTKDVLMPDSIYCSDIGFLWRCESFAGETLFHKAWR